MSKSKTVYVCQNCGSSQPKWAGQCGQCGEWNTLVEEVLEEAGAKLGQRSATVPKGLKLSEVAKSQNQSQRVSTTISELDRVLGGGDSGGMVAGAVMLLGGAPGIGKSTLLTQVVMGVATGGGKLNGESKSNGNSKSGGDKIGAAPNNRQVVYVCGEENPDQIYLRIKRINSNEQQKQTQTESDQKTSTKEILENNVVFLTTTNVDEVVAYLQRVPTVLIIIDSIQTMTTTDLTGVAGSVGQVRECTDRLVRVAKQTRTPLFLIGHITKEGKLAGPMVLEHAVDAVLELTGDRSEEVRLLRAVKNRFGATDEVGVFKMGESGFESVLNPSEIFLGQHDGLTSGAAVAVVMEGTRPLLVEVQALAVRSYLPTPRRIGRGLDSNRLHILTAVLEKHLGLPVSSYDVFVSLTGGFVTKEPAVDLAVCLALVSSITNQPLPSHTACVGEVGLLGEIRPVALFSRRLKEAQRLGYSTVIAHHQRTLRSATEAVGLPTKLIKPKKGE